MKILLTGATGFIGKRLAERLVRDGHELVVLSHSAAKARDQLPWPCAIHEWDPMVELPPAEALRGADAVIHLAGHPVAKERWNVAVKTKIRDSRVIGTRNLAAGLRRLGAAAPKVFVSASAAGGYYGDRGDEILTETSMPGTGFLAEVCRDWEREVRESGLSGTRTASLRFGIVLGNGGGALAKMLPAFRAGVGGYLGSGRQWVSWIHIDDVVGLCLHVLKTPSLSGSVNASSPSPVTNREFTRILAKVVGKPAFLPVPRFVLRAALGEMGGILLSSARVFPEAALVSGYAFRHPELDGALRDLGLGRAEEEFRVQQWFERPVTDIFPFFAKASNLELITPPWLHFRMQGQSTPELRRGTLVNYKLRLHGFPMTWSTRIENWRPEHSFEDHLVKGPYALWDHIHSFEELRGGTLVTDRLRYRVPGGIFGRLLAGPFVKRDLRAIFRYRHDKLKTLFPMRPGKMVPA